MLTLTRPRDFFSELVIGLKTLFLTVRQRLCPRKFFARYRLPALMSAYSARRNDGMFLCKLLVGKPFLAPLQQGRRLQAGYTSHVSDASGSETLMYLSKVTEHLPQPAAPVGAGATRAAPGEVALSSSSPLPRTRSFPRSSRERPSVRRSSACGFERSSLRPGSRGVGQRPVRWCSTADRLPSVPLAGPSSWYSS